MAQNFSTAIVAWTVCFVVTVAVSLVTAPRPPEQLRGLVYSLTERERESATRWYGNPSLLAPLVLAVVIGLNILFW